MGLLIVGGGIGGLTLAVALERHGLPCALRERAPAIDPVGAGLLLSPNATRVLEKIDLLDEVLAVGRSTQRWRILDDWGRVLREIRLPDTDTPGVSIHRADLQRVLLDALPGGRVHLGANVTRVEVHRDHVTVARDDGDVVDAEACRVCAGTRPWGNGSPCRRAC